MYHISIRKFGLAFGVTGGLLYFGCALVMLLSGRESSVKFFNNLLHGMDVSSIIRMDMPPIEMLIGGIEAFIISWLIGACIAGVYNVSLYKKS